MLPILSKDLSKSAIFERFEIFKMIKTKTSKNTIGKSVSTEILPKIKKEQTKKIIIDLAITTFLNTEIIVKE